MAVTALPLPPSARVHLIAIGKAAQAMTTGALTGLADLGLALDRGVAVAPAPAADAREAQIGGRVRVMFGDHPIPAERSAAAAAGVAEIASRAGPTDHVLALVSGGGSSLVAAPAPDAAGLTQRELGELYAALLASGADIHLVNAVRKRFAWWTGGRLAVALAPAFTHCLAVSDVTGDDLAVISSGPCVADPLHAAALIAVLHSTRLWSQLPHTARQHLDAVANGRAPETPKPDAPAFRHVSARVIVSNRQALESAAERARAAGIDEVTIVDAALTGEASIAGVRLASDLIARRKRARGARRSRCVLWGGETTVTLGGGFGSPAGGATEDPLGGRSQELALAAARSLADAGEQAAGITLLAAGTDGRDGPTDAAGAFVDNSTWAAVAAAGRHPAADLAQHEAYRALDAAGALFRPGLTGTNVMDVAIGLLL